MAIRFVSRPVNTTDGNGTGLEWNRRFQTARNIQFNRAQGIIDESVLLYNSPYVPFDKGILNKSGILFTDVGTGLVVYKTPYARKLYYSPSLNFQGAPLRGAYWFERMKASHKGDIAKKAGVVLK